MSKCVFSSYHIIKRVDIYKKGRNKSIKKGVLHIIRGVYPTQKSGAP